MANPSTPSKTEGKATFWPPDSPIKATDRQASLDNWKDLADLVNKQPTKAASQDVINSNLVFLHRFASEQGLQANMKDALRSTGNIKKARVQREDDSASDDDGSSSSNDDSSSSSSPGSDDEKKTRSKDKDKKKGKTATSGQIQAALVKLVLPLSPRFTVDALSAVRDTFVERLKTKEISVQEANNGPWTTKRLTTDEVAAFTNLLFDEMWGMPALRNLANMIRTYSSTADDFGNAGTFMRAMQYSQKAEVPEVCRRVVLDVGRCVELGSKESQALRGLKLNIAFYHLLHSYNALIASLRADDEDVRAQMEELDVKTGKGHTLANQARSFLAKSTSTTNKNVISNNISAAQALAELFDFHGGVRLAALLPAAIGRRLARMGMSKTTAVIELYKEVCAEMKEDMDHCCELAGKIIVTPVYEGKACLYQPPVAGHQRPLLTRLREVTLEDVAMGDTEE